MQSDNCSEMLFFSIPSENTQGILVIYEEVAEEWALYLKSIFKHIVLEDRILLYDLEAPSIHHSEVPLLCSYRCKLLIISNGLLKGLNVKKRYFLNKILQPPERVAILLCGVEDSALIYQTLNIDKCYQLMTTDQGPEDYLAVISDIIQQGTILPPFFSLLLIYIYFKEKYASLEIVLLCFMLKHFLK